MIDLQYATVSRVGGKAVVRLWSAEGEPLTVDELRARLTSWRRALREAEAMQRRMDATCKNL